MTHDPDETRVGPPPSDDPGDKDTDPRIGTVLAGRYRIVRLLGRGAQGTVYVGEHLKIGRRDAIKVLLPSLLSDHDAVARFTRGASNASRISHPNVCTVYDFGDTEDGLPFMASELVEGEELHDVMRREAPFPLERAVDLVDQIAAGLHAAHELGIVHRDLKPANVMITRGRGGKEVVKVVDFDIAKGMGDAEPTGSAPLTQAGWIIGTPQYMSPEQITASDLDGRSDTYSLALIFFEMLTGKLPNDVSSTQKLMWQRINSERRRLEDVLPHADFPEGLQDVFDRALAADREDRPPTALDFAKEVRRAVAGSGARAHAATVAAEAAERTVAVPRTAAEAGGAGAVPPTRADGGSGATSKRLLVAGGVGGLAVAALAVAFGTGLLGGGAGVTLTVPGPQSLTVGDSVALGEVVRLADAETGEPVVGDVRYETLQGDVASVDASGVLRAFGVGETSIVVRADGLEDTIALTVSERVAAASDSGAAGGDASGADENPTEIEPLAREDDPEGEGGRGNRPGVPDPAERAEEVEERLWNPALIEGFDRLAEDRLQSLLTVTAEAWDRPAFSDSTRARAAWLHARALGRLGADPAERCRWAGRAFELAPGIRSYRALTLGCVVP